MLHRTEWFAPEHGPLMSLYVALVRNSGDLPTRLWIQTPVELQLEKRVFMRGNMRGFDCTHEGREYSVCVPMIDAEPDDHSKFWADIQVHYCSPFFVSVVPCQD